MRNLFTIFFIFATLISFSQDKQYKIVTVAFYNIENVFDTIVDQDTSKILQDDFTPKGPHNWTSEKYYKKLDNIAHVISDIGAEKAKVPPAVIGISEIENKSVLIDLTQREKLKKYNYQIIHYESPDKRGIDVALLYRPNAFKLIESKTFTLNIPEKPDFHTRDQLLVKGTIDGEIFYFIVNHWPSRSGGEKRSKPFREAAARLAKSISDSIVATNVNAKVIIMGDLNDDPVNSSVKKYLNAKGTKDISSDQMYNPMLDLYNKGIGSLAYRDNWNLFDQIIITKGLLGNYSDGYNFHKAHVYNKRYLKQQSGKYKGYPHRTFVGDNFIDGYSDHFPVYIYLLKEIK